MVVCTLLLYLFVCFLSPPHPFPTFLCRFSSTRQIYMKLSYGSLKVPKDKISDN